MNTPIAPLLASLRPGPHRRRRLLTVCAIVLAMAALCALSLLAVECAAKVGQVGQVGRLAFAEHSVSVHARLCVGPRWCRALCETYGLEDRRTYTGNACHREPIAEYLAHAVRHERTDAAHLAP